MATFKIIKASESESTLEMKSKNSKIEKKYQDDILQTSVMHLSVDRILYIDPVPSSEAYKSYYVVKGSCFVFDDGSVLREGDLLIFRGVGEVKTLKTLEDTILLVHATNYDVYRTLEKNQDTVDKLLKEIQTKDHYTGEHSLRVYELVKRLAVKLGYKDKALNNITKAAYYHDLGKIHVPDEILNKPSRLNDDEFEEIKNHVHYAKDTVLEHFNEDVLSIILQHHERVNGSGYPLGLKGDEIRREARILAVCDSFDAMITDRVYKTGKSMEVALLELKELSGVQYDSEIVSAFIAMMLE